ncbi:hypothetical protein BDN70DRAFT_673495 [Pholiota conissans]|uniref:Uncharacterized protein n=1 Tax=Pholiota conissans TaxID=109636 RepID=A0A9P5YK68_9AGAR|nr:hypothetical protein BDN70DRAFT_673495 [Pholiota conissans]
MGRRRHCVSCLDGILSIPSRSMFAISIVILDRISLGYPSSREDAFKIKSIYAVGSFTFFIRLEKSSLLCVVLGLEGTHVHTQCTIYARPRCMNPARLRIIRLGSDNSVKTCVSAGNERLEYSRSPNGLRYAPGLPIVRSFLDFFLFERFDHRVLRLGWFWLGILRFAYRFCPSMNSPSCFAFSPL